MKIRRSSAKKIHLMDMFLAYESRDRITLENLNYLVSLSRHANRQIYLISFCRLDSITTPKFPTVIVVDKLMNAILIFWILKNIFSRTLILKQGIDKNFSSSIHKDLSLPLKAYGNKTNYIFEEFTLKGNIGTEDFERIKKLV
nr:hypothetical protein 9 [Candidatus Omnitrophota bacterium]